ncbi:L-iditol 2-dehydrogenase [Flavilitoribacter nigricans DSM 23189 = NBRC 102662]|uniref:L-iditol 2-dehydrogenase n=2 Tax=Flavilitoribacter TaxID=2762562 RepID=A0A2D0NIJ4_FLAN2|nr:L-iditol 2-dehydrogenase [Flavilitoribacter nigricans DSM 23189 = NBRC 102662]
MKAALLSEPRRIEIRDVDLPDPGPGEVRIRLKMVGICGSDVHLFLGHRPLEKPTIIGHEGLGHIDKIGSGVTDRMPGQRVVIEPNIPCLQCSMCRSGRGNACPNKRVIGLNRDGCFAEYVCLPAEYAWPIPESITDEQAVTIEPTAVSIHALFASKARPGDTIAVIGLGAIGLLLTHVALSLGYRVFTVEIIPDKQKLAMEMGAEVIPTEQEISATELNRIWTDSEVVAVFECAGVAQTASLATAAAPQGAEIVLLGLSDQQATFQPLKIARQSISILPSIVYDHPFDFRRTIQLIAAGIITPGMIISNYVSLPDLQSGLEQAAAGGDSKIIVRI